MSARHGIARAGPGRPGQKGICRFMRKMSTHPRSVAQGGDEGENPPCAGRILCESLRRRGVTGERGEVSLVVELLEEQGSCVSKSRNRPRHIREAAETAVPLFQAGGGISRRFGGAGLGGRTGNFGRSPALLEKAVARGTRQGKRFYAIAELCPSLTAVFMFVTSLRGDSPNSRLYSRLNCVALS